MVQDLLLLAGWHGAMSDDTARMLISAGVAAFFVAILELRGSYEDLRARRELSGNASAVRWKPDASALESKLRVMIQQSKTASLPWKESRIYDLMCTYLESKWPGIFESTDPIPDAMELASKLVTNLGTAETQTSQPVLWSRTTKQDVMRFVTNFGSDGAPPVMVETKFIPDGLPEADVQLCLELIEVGRGLVESRENANAWLGVNFSPSLYYASLEPFHRNGLDPVNLDEAQWMLTVENNARGNGTRIDADLGHPDAFTAFGFVFDTDHEQSLARRPFDFRLASQRVRQLQFVRHYLRLVAQCNVGGSANDDVTVIMNMAARLDRMWRRDFPAHGIVGMEPKKALRAEWQAKFGGDAQRAMNDVAAVMQLGGESAGFVRSIIGRLGSDYMNINFQWPNPMTPELKQLRHELQIFAYNRHALPFAMERLALDIIAVEACCVYVMNSIDSMKSTADAQQSWAIACFAMFTVLDLRPIFMSMALPLQMQSTPASDKTPLEIQLDAWRRSNDKR